MNRKIDAILYILAGCFIILIDQFTKRWALSAAVEGACRISSGLFFELVLNRGISWGMFSSSTSWVFWVITAIILVLTLFVARLAYQGFLKHRFIIGELFVVAGALSNLIDRVFYQAVIDFVHLTFYGWSWPIFNVADCFIVFGGILMFITYNRD